MSLVGLGMLGWSAYESADFLLILTRGHTVDAVSVSSVEGLRRGHYTTRVAYEGQECTLEAVHAEPGEHVQVIVSATDPSHCLADAFFPTLYQPLAILAFALLCVAVAVSDARKLT